MDEPEREAAQLLISGTELQTGWGHVGFEFPQTLLTSGDARCNSLLPPTWTLAFRRLTTVHVSRSPSAQPSFRR